MGNILDVLKDRRYFFDQGIRFECQKCGGCCTGDPGYIYVGDQEITTIARFLHISREQFVDEYLYPVQDRYSIGEYEDGRCLFFGDGCMIYSVRPKQCRTFPFWFQNLRSEGRWRTVRRRCPGIGKGPRYSKQEILKFMESTLPL